MKLTKFNVVSMCLVILVLFILTGRIFDMPIMSDYSWIFVFPLFAYLYYGLTKEHNHFFGFFLIGFSIVEMLKIVFSGNELIGVYGANYLIIATYLSLIIFLVKDLDIKKIFKDFKLPMIVLVVFNAYIIYALNEMILEDPKVETSSLEFVTNVIYNVFIQLVLSLALIHYLYHQTKQSLLLFLASVCIVFSEMVQVAYLFISSEQILEIIYSMLMGLGFYFLYVYIKIRHFDSYKTESPAIV
ncbi:hypothetical protein [Olleya namhaensis]|uniref:hypothetical protein n=2 Tax=Olleya namhaensis TaxID=1144750 RepID=UPI0024937221|nr:hypothetical protein [Olleya namhaensis]